MKKDPLFAPQNILSWNLCFLKFVRLSSCDISWAPGPIPGLTGYALDNCDLENRKYFNPDIRKTSFYTLESKKKI